MTRFEALNIAMGIVEGSDHPKKADIIAKLEQCTWKLSKRKWSEEKIFAYCNKVMEERGRVLTSDFGIPGAPGHGDITQVFKLSAREFRDTYYPLNSPLSPMSMYFYRTADEWTALFVADYQRIKPKTQSEYNKKRQDGLPRWNAIARMNNLTSWRELLASLGLKEYIFNQKLGIVTSTSRSQQAIEEFDAMEDQKSATE